MTAHCKAATAFGTFEHLDFGFVSDFGFIPHISCIMLAHMASNLLQLLQNGKVNSRNTEGRATQSAWSGLSIHLRLL